jgi:glycosyltransferase involved in cell wall biosynthesis
MTDREVLPRPVDSGARYSPRVLLVITSNQRRGAESFGTLLGRQLDARGMRALVLALAPTSVEPESALPVEALGRRPLAPTTLWNLRRAMRRADLVVACGSTTLPASVIAGVGTGRPVVYQNIGDPTFWAGSFARRHRVRALLRQTTAVAAITEQSAEVIESMFGVPAGRIRVLRNARSSTRFHPAQPEQRATARQSLGLPGDAQVVAIVGALSVEKRVHLAVSAIGRLPVPVRLLVAGDGPLRPELERQAASEAPGRVSFLGQAEDPTAVYHAADAVVLTSQSEGVPGVLIEAGLSGLPVVATDVGYVRDVVVPHETGELVPAGDGGAVGPALSAVLADAARLGANARRHCVARFDLERVSDEWAALIHDVLDE